MPAYYCQLTADGRTDGWRLYRAKSQGDAVKQAFLSWGRDVSIHDDQGGPREVDTMHGTTTEHTYRGVLHNRNGYVRVREVVAEVGTVTP